MANRFVAGAIIADGTGTLDIDQLSVFVTGPGFNLGIALLERVNHAIQYKFYTLFLGQRF